MNDKRFALDAETIRRTGYAMVDMLAAYLTNPNVPVLREASVAEMTHRIDGAQPLEPLPYEEILATLGRDVLPFMSRGDHPGYFAYIPSCGTWPAALGDLVASACNIYCGSWQESAGPSRLELVVLDWFKQWLGFPLTASGVLVSGGSTANMTALACARELCCGAMNDNIVAYVSDQAHSSLARAGRILGFRPDQVRVLPADDRCRLRLDALEGAIAADLRAGRRPFFVSASAGSTNTGAIDPLPAIADLCAKYQLWMHVDGAYGGFAALTERGRLALAGIERADSITLDPHKWLYQPFECGCLLVREGTRLRRAFEITPEYLHDAVVGGAETNFSDLGFQLSRMSRALKLWVSLNYFGINAYRATIDRTLDLAAMARDYIDKSPQLELMLQPELGIVCFRRQGLESADEVTIEEENHALIRQLTETGTAFVSSTRLKRRFAVRLCVLNHTSSEADILRVLRFFEETIPLVAPDDQATGQPAAATGIGIDLRSGGGSAWSLRSGVSPELLSRFALFSCLDDNAITWAACASHLIERAVGEVVVERWDYSRDFYLIIDGSVSIDIDGNHVRDLGSGDYFGELAALDWGAGFGYVRLATATAITPLRLMVMPQTVLAELVAKNPTFAKVIEDVARERLKKS